jgi:hypothetical protein
MAQAPQSAICMSDATARALSVLVPLPSPHSNAGLFLVAVDSDQWPVAGHATKLNVRRRRASTRRPCSRNGSLRGTEHLRQPNGNRCPCSRRRDTSPCAAKLYVATCAAGAGRQVGYMNAHHQRIIARATICGEPDTRFVMWCSMCGHHYVTDESEGVRTTMTDGRRLPQTAAAWNG